MALLGAKKKTAAPAPQLSQFVTFRVGTEDYGLPIAAIAEVVRPLRITPLPRMPEFVEGVINLRGTIIPVVDLRKRFALDGGGRDPRKARMLITRGAWPEGSARSRGLLALLADSVSDVITLSAREIDPAPAAARGEHAEFISGMGKRGDQLIILIDLTRVLSRQERMALAAADDIHA